MTRENAEIRLERGQDRSCRLKKPVEIVACLANPQRFSTL